MSKRATTRDVQAAIMMPLDLMNKRPKCPLKARAMCIDRYVLAPLKAAGKTYSYSMECGVPTILKVALYLETRS